MTASLRQLMPLLLGFIAGVTASIVEAQISPGLAPEPQRSPVQLQNAHIA